LPVPASSCQHSTTTSRLESWRLSDVCCCALCALPTHHHLVSFHVCSAPRLRTRPPAACCCPTRQRRSPPLARWARIGGGPPEGSEGEECNACQATTAMQRLWAAAHRHCTQEGDVGAQQQQQQQCRCSGSGRLQALYMSLCIVAAAICSCMPCSRTRR
jgi:hypothetical protein